MDAESEGNTLLFVSATGEYGSDAVILLKMQVKRTSEPIATAVATSVFILSGEELSDPNGCFIRLCLGSMVLLGKQYLTCSEMFIGR